MNELTQQTNKLRTTAMKILRTVLFVLGAVGLTAVFLSLMLLTCTYIIGNQISFYLGSVLVIPFYILSFLPILVFGFFLVFTITGLMAVLGIDGERVRSGGLSSGEAFVILLTSPISAAIAWLIWHEDKPYKAKQAVEIGVAMLVLEAIAIWLFLFH
jgi:hypothetical protein